MPRFQDIPQYTQCSGYSVDISWNYLPTHLESQINNYKLELDPDFQRGHVWDDTKRVRYVEFVLRGGRSGRDLFTNCPGWNRGRTGNYVLVDGKQRLEAVTRFLHNELTVFGGHYFRDYSDSLPIVQASFRWHVNELDTRAEVLTWYLELNDGGVVHTSEELARVRGLLEKEKV